jgi:argininosuccinate lyase
MAVWGGRFSEAPDALFRRFNDSLPFDWRLLPYDIRGSIAWARAIHGAGVLTATERDALIAALESLGRQTQADPHAIVAAGDEDVHSWVERTLIERVGDLGKKLHTGRSRNDQVATDLRLFALDEQAARIAELRAAQLSLLSVAERYQDAVIPGYTHLQRAQPVLFAHWALAYFEMLDRDAERFADASRRTRGCPLGSGALAGTAYRVDRHAIARELALGQPTANSLDAVSDRDFALETLSAAATCALHLSRLAEDLIIYSTGEFAFVELGDRVTSGSSLMPQKKNPDALELIRGKSGRILGAHTSLAVTLKGLPLAYNKDLQEDKEPLFDSMDHLSLCLRMLPIVLDSMTLNVANALAAARGGHANATELADYLVERSVPFREAHEITGRIVRIALERACALEELPLAEMQRIAPVIDQGVFARLTVQSLLARRDIPGGVAPNRVAEALAEARRRVEKE